MNFLIRGAEPRDTEGLQELSKHFHLCSLNSETSNLEKKIRVSQDSFSNRVPKKEKNFLFVLEDLSQNKIIGTSQIFSEYGTSHFPYYYYSLESEVLNLKEDQDPKTHLGGLLLHPAYRSKKFKLAPQIGLIRFLFIAAFPEEFSNRIEIALTAPLTDNNESYFWDSVGKKYLSLDYKEATEFFQRDPHNFYSHFKKGLKIPLEDISPEAIKVLGEVHHKTMSVYRAALKLGFKKVHKYHILDGGFSMEASQDKVSFIQQVKKVFIKEATVPESFDYLWGQQSSHEFKGGLVKGSLKNNELFVHEIPSQILRKEQIIISRIS